jgi:hypothetical protein
LKLGFFEQLQGFAMSGAGRCDWCGDDPLYVAYHDTEWGVPERDGRALWEKLILDGFRRGFPGSRSCASATRSARRSTGSIRR